MTDYAITSPASASFGTKFWQAICEVAENLHRRMQIHASLGALSDRHLRDIGLTRHEVSAVAGIPLPQDASELLAGARRSRPGGW